MKDNGAAVGFENEVKDRGDILILRLRGLGRRREELGTDGDQLREGLVHNTFEDIRVLAVASNAYTRTSASNPST